MQGQSIEPGADAFVVINNPKGPYLLAHDPLKKNFPVGYVLAEADDIAKEKEGFRRKTIRSHKKRDGLGSVLISVVSIIFAVWLVFQKLCLRVSFL